MNKNRVTWPLRCFGGPSDGCIVDVSQGMRTVQVIDPREPIKTYFCDKPPESVVFKYTLYRVQAIGHSFPSWNACEPNRPFYRFVLIPNTSKDDEFTPVELLEMWDHGRCWT